MAGTISERLALIIDAKTGGAVTEITKAAKSVESLQVTQDKAALSSAKMQAALDKEALSAAKVAGETDKLAALQSKAQASKLAAANAADKLAVSQLAAADGAKTLGAASTSMGSQIVAGISKVGPAIAAAGIVKFMSDGIKAFTDLGAQVRAFQAVTNSSAQSSSLLVGQMKALGVEPEVAAKAFQRFGAALGDGTSKLDQFGVTIAHNKDGTTDLVTTFDNLRTAYQNSADGATKDAIAKQLSLRAGTALVPLLTATKEQIAAINAETSRRGGVLSQSDVDKAFQLKIATNEMKLAFQGLEMSIAKGIVPALTDALGVVTQIVDKLHTVSSFKIGGPAPKTGVRGKADSILKRYLEDGGILSLLGGGGGSKKLQDQAAGQAGADQIAQTQEQNAAVADKLTSSLRAEVDAEKAVTDAARSLADAKQNEIKAQDAYDKLLKAGAVDAKAVAAAEKEVASASREVQRAVEAEQKAQDTLNKARERASALDLEEAANKVALAGDEITIRQQAAKSAQEALDNLQGSGSASADEISAAQAAVKKANDEITGAVVGLGKAQEDQQKVQQKGTDADPAVAAALLGVRDAHQNVIDAVDRQKDSEQKLRDAQAGDPDFADKLAAAQQRVADAHQAIADAQTAQASAAEDAAIKTQALNEQLAALPAGVLDSVANNLLGLLSLGVSASVISGEIAKLYPDGVSGAGPNNLATYVSGLTPITGARAAGGPVSANGTYLVGENGPELLHMGAAAGYVSANGGGHTVVQQVTVVDQSQLARQLGREAAWSLATLPPVRRAV